MTKISKSPPLKLLVIVFLILGLSTFLSERLRFDKLKRTRERDQQLLNEQKFTTFKEGLFEIDYPYWPNVNQNSLVVEDKIKIAVGNAGCNLFLTRRDLPKDKDYKTFVQELVTEQLNKQANAIIVKEAVTNNQSYFASQFGLENKTIYSESYAFLTSKNQIYSTVFMAEKGIFETACKPYITKTIKSVRVK